MGLVSSVLSKLTKKKITTKERLEKIEEDIENIQNLLKRNREKQRSAVLFLLVTSISIYLICAAVFYLFYMPKKLVDRLLFLVPFLLFPFLVIGLKKLLHYVFVTRIAKNSRQLEDLKKEKQKILENVMETETYKVAKEILEKFDPNRKLVEKDKNEKKTPQPQQANGTELRKRAGQQQQPHPRQIMTPRPMIASTPQMMNNNGTPFPPRMPQQQFQGTPHFRGPHPGMPRPATPAPILPRDRSIVDKVAEYFVGDGPSNRYALICKQCAGHNGMALAEEFMFIAYKCCYCGMLNPARKQRLQAPKLEKPKQTLSRENSMSSLNQTQSSGAEEDEDSKEEGEDETKQRRSVIDEEENEESPTHSDDDNNDAQGNDEPVKEQSASDGETNTKKSENEDMTE